MIENILAIIIINIRAMNITLDKLSAATAILTFLIFIGYRYYNGMDLVLTNVVLAAIAGGMLPLAIGLVLYPFFPSFIDSIEKRGLQITLTGLVLVYVYANTILEKLRDTS